MLAVVAADRVLLVWACVANLMQVVTADRVLLVWAYLAILV